MREECEETTEPNPHVPRETDGLKSLEDGSVDLTSDHARHRYWRCVWTVGYL